MSSADNGNLISAGSKGGTLAGGDGNDTLVGGAGVDVFEYSGGDDVISNYTQMKDRIRFTVEIEDVQVNDDDVEFITANGFLTVENAVGEKIKTVD